jgi:glycosyltransferase involved in cell wall biosynthesis
MIAYSLTAGGAERIVANAFRHLSRDSRFDWVKLYLFDLSREKGTNFYLSETGLSAENIVLLDDKCDIHAPFSFLEPAHARIAQAIFNQLQVDRPAVVHASLEPMTILAGLAAVLANVPRVVMHTHNMRPTSLFPSAALPPRLRGCYRALLQRSGVCLVGCAEAVISDYASWIGTDICAEYHVVHNGLILEDIVKAGNPDEMRSLRGSLGLEPDAPLIGTAFKFRNEKRPFLWVDVAELVLAARPECRFVMFGDGELWAATKAYVRSKGLERHVAFPGLVSDLYSQLCILQLFVLSSNCEALPNVLLEAQAAGVPVIAYRVGGIEEALRAGVTGALVGEDTPSALAAEILRALSDSDWLCKAAAAGPAFVHDNFGFAQMVTNLSKVLLQPTSSDRPIS